LDANSSYVLASSNGGISIIRIRTAGQGQAHSFQTDSSHDMLGLHLQTYSLDGIVNLGKEQRVNISMWWPLGCFSRLPLMLIIAHIVKYRTQGRAACCGTCHYSRKCLWKNPGLVLKAVQMVGEAVVRAAVQ
jgi:hypothetical protein